MSSWRDSPAVGRMSDVGESPTDIPRALSLPLFRPAASYPAKNVHRNYQLWSRLPLLHYLAPAHDGNGRDSYVVGATPAKGARDNCLRRDPFRKPEWPIWENELLSRASISRTELPEGSVRCGALLASWTASMPGYGKFRQIRRFVLPNCAGTTRRLSDECLDCCIGLHLKGTG